MNRRSFISSIIAAAAAPAIVRADSLMRIVPMETIVAVDAFGVRGLASAPLMLMRSLNLNEMWMGVAPEGRRLEWVGVK